MRMRPAPETDKRNGTAEANRKQDFANCPSFAKQNRKYVSRSTAVGGLFCNATARRALERCCNHSRYGGWLWKLRSNNKDNMSPHNSSHSPRAPVLHVTSWLPLYTQRQHQFVLRIGVGFVTKPAGRGAPTSHSHDGPNERPKRGPQRASPTTPQKFWGAQPNLGHTNPCGLIFNEKSLCFCYVYPYQKIGAQIGAQIGAHNFQCRKFGSRPSCAVTFNEKH